MDIPEKWEKLANEPIDSPLWHSSDGEEYQFTADAEWVVLNEKLGPYRLRHICKIMKEIRIEPIG